MVYIDFVFPLDHDYGILGMMLEHSMAGTSAFPATEHFGLKILLTDPHCVLRWKFKAEMEKLPPYAAPLFQV